MIYDAVSVNNKLEVIDMKPKNFPARKLARKLRAQGEYLINHEYELNAARAIRTKKRRGGN